MALLALLRRSARLPVRAYFAPISTSSKKKENLVFPEDVFPKKSGPAPKTVEDFAETKNPKNWVSYGFNDEDYEQDRHEFRVTFFLFVTVVLVGGTFLYSYLPDPKQLDWALREAYLQIHEREKKGLPLIDKNYVDPAKVELPTDEELGDTEIII